MPEENCNLLIRHLPTEWTKDDLESLFQQLVPATILNFDDKKKSAVVEFKNEATARDIMSSLHQFEIGNRRLVVEFARESEIFTSCVEKNSERSKEGETEAAVSSYLKRWQSYLQSLSHVSEKWDIRYSSSTALRYFYPPPSSSILKNIVVAISVYPRFYTQVLHLMNKMHLPCPFDAEFNVPESIKNVFNMTNTEQEADSEESELVSSGDETKNKLLNFASRRKRQRGKIQLTAAKRMRPPVSSTATPSVPVGEVFEKASPSTQRRIDIKIVNEPSEPVQDIPLPTGNGFGLIGPSVVEETAVAEDMDESNRDDVPIGILSSQTLARGQLSEKEMSTLSVFKRYEPGEPSQRLYVKNVARGVTEEDLRGVFGSFVKWGEELERETFFVQLLTTGRMKGQAFITFASEKAAELALKGVNGFVLNDKPLVVQFARATKAKPDDRSLVTEPE